MNSMKIPVNTEGSAYGRSPAKPNTLLTEVGAGTPCGEMFRRYWHPVAASADLTSVRPMEVRILGEDLILFRDGSGKPGLLYSRCMHRGTSLGYGKIEKSGIRCCYHGWLYDTEGRCLEQPLEPAGKVIKVRQPWYPVEERYGLVFAYMGPLDKKPALPRYDILENIAPGQFYDTAFGSWGTTDDHSLPVVPYSWLNLSDNFMDPLHVYVLHSTFSGPQFDAELAAIPKMEFIRTDTGIIHSSVRTLEDGRVFERLVEWIAPNILSVPPVRPIAEGPALGVSWIVPVDDTHMFQVLVAKASNGKRIYFPRPNNNTRAAWGEMSERERRDNPNDFEAQVGQGPVSLHSEEHLSMSDRGLVMQRRAITKAITDVQEGGTPINVQFSIDEAVVKVQARNLFRPAESKE